MMMMMMADLGRNMQRLLSDALFCSTLRHSRVMVFLLDSKLFINRIGRSVSDWLRAGGSMV
jgi:hypothetical protein